MQTIDSRLGETALHEAAHAVVAAKVSTRRPGLAENGVVTIEPDEFRAGYVCLNRMNAEQHILVCLAGGMASARLKTPPAISLDGHRSVVRRLKHDTSGDAQIIAHYLSLLHPSKQMIALEWLVFEESRLSRPVSITAEASRGAYQDLSESEKEDAKLLAELFAFAVAVLCAWGDSAAARQVIIQQLPGTSRLRRFCDSTGSDSTDKVMDLLEAVLLGAPWFKTLSDSTDKVSDLLDEYGHVVSALADRLLEVRTMTGTEAERFIREAA